jgi:2,3,4,5-tetrahydropyridine-2-carboxylate N-succinyltransferase
MTTSAADTNAWGLGLATLDATGATLDTWYPAPELGTAPEEAEDSELARQLAGAAHEDALRGTRQEVVLREIELAAPPADTSDAYLRLHLLSHRLIQPNVQNLDGLFGVLTNVVWTSEGPCAVEGFEKVRLALRAAGRTPTVYSVDKFPRMVDYVLPSGVRIGDADRVRLGAHLAEGTTVMHAGFVNYNAGTSPRASSSRTGPTWVAAPPPWAPSPAAAPSGCASAAGPSWAPRPGSGSPSATTPWSRPDCM